MLTDSAMAQALIGAVSGMTSFTAPTVYTSALADYVISNIEITGSYSGMTTTVPSVTDPLSGPVSLKISFPKLLSAPSTVAFVTGRDTPDVFGFISALMDDASGAIVTLTSPYTGVSTGTFTAVSPDLEALKECKTMEDAWLEMSKALVSSFKSLQIAQPIPTTTTSPGAGVTTGFTVI